MVSDLGEDPSEPRLRMDVVEFCRFDQGLGDCHGFATAFGACEQPVFPTYGHRFDGALGGVVIQFKMSVL